MYMRVSVHLHVPCRGNRGLAQLDRGPLLLREMLHRVVPSRLAEPRHPDPSDRRECVTLEGMHPHVDRTSPDLPYGPHPFDHIVGETPRAQAILVLVREGDRRLEVLHYDDARQRAKGFLDPCIALSRWLEDQGRLIAEPCMDFPSTEYLGPGIGGTLDVGFDFVKGSLVDEGAVRRGGVTKRSELEGLDLPITVGRYRLNSGLGGYHTGAGAAFLTSAAINSSATGL